jgi:Cys-tRNA(Pro)/Cys-tRNA(Cys) deacylase
VLQCSVRTRTDLFLLLYQARDMREEDRTPVTNYLDSVNIPYRLFRHPGPVDSLEQAAEERGQQPEQVVRSILFRLAKGQYAMVLMAGPDQISWPALRGYFGQSRLTTASRDEVLSVTGYKFGAVSPFGLPKPLRILVDASVLTQEEVSIGSGERGLTVILNTGDLMRALNNPEVGQFGKEPHS